MHRSSTYSELIRELYNIADGTLVNLLELNCLYIIERNDEDRKLCVCVCVCKVRC